MLEQSDENSSEGTAELMGDATLIALVERHDKDLYRGDSRLPGLATRVEVQEKEMENVKSTVEQINSRFWIILLFIAGTFVTVIAEAVWKLNK